MAGLALLLGMGLSPMARAVSIADEAVEVEYRDGVYVAHLAVSVGVPPRLALAVLTDFEQMPAFMPGLEESRVVSHGERRWQVQQRGQVRFGPFRFAFANERVIEQLPDGRIVATGLSGFRKMHSELRTQGASGGTLLDYRIELQPEQWIPSGLGVNVMQHQLASQFSALTTEMERRLQAERQK